VLSTSPSRTDETISEGGKNSARLVVKREAVSLNVRIGVGSLRKVGRRGYMPFYGLNHNSMILPELGEGRGRDHCN
jgi:hypothetical protein